MLYPKRNIARDFIKLDGFWEFKEDRDNIGLLEKWYVNFPHHRNIAVPASWNEQYTDLFNYMGKCWYHNKSFIPLNWESKHIWIRIGSACQKSEIWINGTFLGKHEGGHLPFEFDITEYILLGSTNNITIAVDNTLDPWGLPPAYLDGNEAREGFFNCNPTVTYDFYPYGGIHRPVYIYCTSACRVEDITIKTEIDEKSGIVNFEIKLTYPLTANIEICSADMSYNLIINDEDIISGKFIIPVAQFWEPKNPYLYELEIKIFSNDIILDSYTQKYGIRTVEILENNFLLNGKSFFFKGFGKHEDFNVIGKGLSYSLIVKDFELLKWTGANSFRTSHYPYAEEVLDFADKEGILIIDETPFVGLNDRMYTEDILNKANLIINELITRDKNHPSVVAWSLANEPNINTEAGENFFESLASTARKLDNTRPITYVAHLEPENNRCIKFYDFIALNKYYGWYINPGEIDGSLNGLSQCIDNYYRIFKKPVFITEFGADAIEGMHFNPPQMFTEEYQAEILVKQYNIIKNKDFCIGAHIWTFADFKTAQSISRVIYNRKGVFTRERQPKAAAYKVREMWLEN